MVKLEEHKSQTHHKQIEVMPLPQVACIPLSQHLGKICAPIVKVGDSVSVGQKIGDIAAKVYAPIHSSISGKVIAIQDSPHPVLGQCKAVIVENDGTDKTHDTPFGYAQGKRHTTHDKIDTLSADDIRKIVFEAGIVGMGGAGFPTHIKLEPSKPVDALMVNGAECEPYLTGDFRLMVEKTKEILLGVELARRCLGVNKVYIAIEDNKPEAIEKFREGIRDIPGLHSGQAGYPSTASFDRLRTSLGAGGIRVLKSAYPQGGEKQLIKNILSREVPSGKLPFDVGVVVHNVATCFAIYEAAYLNKPLIERLVTITGTCIANPKNLLVRIGTPIKELIDSCGPLKEEPAKIIIGGPMMGIAQYTTEVPVIKSTTGVVLLNEEEARTQEEEFCIRCGACVRACPAGLMPCLINLASEKEAWTLTKAYGCLDCIECGLCNYVCPAKRRLTQTIKRAKIEGMK